MTSRVCTCNRLNYLLVTTPESLILLFKPHAPPTHSCGRPAQFLLAFLDDRNLVFHSFSRSWVNQSRASSISLLVLSRQWRIFVCLRVMSSCSCLCTSRASFTPAFSGFFVVFGGLVCASHSWNRRVSKDTQASSDPPV